METPETRAKLAEGIRQLQAKGDTNSVTQLVSAYKAKYQTQTQTPATPEPTLAQNIQQGGQNIMKDITGAEVNKSTSFIPSVVRNTVGSEGITGLWQNLIKSFNAKGTIEQTTNQSQTAEGLFNQAMDLLVKAKTEIDPIKKAKYQTLAQDLIKNTQNLQQNTNELNSTVPTQGQIAGTALNTALTVATGGTNSIAAKLGLKGLAGAGARAVENAGIGASYQVASNLQKGNPLSKDVVSTALLSGGIPLGIEGAGTLKNKILGEAMPTAEHAINSLIKPLGKDFAYGKNPARGILNEGIVANTFDDLSNQVSQKISSVGSEIGTLGQKLDQSGQISLNLTPALAPIDSAIEDAAKSNNKTLFQSLQNVKTALLHDLSVGVDEKGVPAIVQGDPKNLITAGYNEAKQFLTDIAEHTRFTGNPSDDKALNMATKQAYGIVRDLMNKGADSVSKEDGAMIRDLNSRYADLLSARNAINHRDIVLQRQNFLNIADKFAIPVSIGGAMMTGLATGDWGKAGTVLVAELGGIAATKAVGSTASITRVAQFLSKLAPQERIGILNSTPVLKNLWERTTGQTTPEIGAPKTKTLQTVEDYIKNPKLGMSIEDVSKNNALLSEAQKYKSAEEFVKGQGTPKTVNVFVKSKFSDKTGRADFPVIRKEENITLYQGSKAGDNRQFWTSDKKYAEQFGDVKEKTGDFYKVDNGNRVTDVYVEAPTKSQLTDIWNKANKNK